MKEIFLIGAVQAFFLSLLLITKKNKIFADYVLSIWLIFTGIPLFLYFLNYSEYTYILTHSQSIPTYLMVINIPLILIQCPFVFIYVAVIVNRKKIKFKTSYLLHFIPAIVFLIIIFSTVKLNPANKTEFDLQDSSLYWLIISFFPLTFLMSIIYIAKSFLLIRNYKRNILQQFSNTEKFDLNWLRNLVILIAIMWSLLGIMTLTFKFYNNLHLIHHVVLFSATVVIFIIGYFGLKRTNIFISLPKQPRGIIDNKPVIRTNTDIDTKKKEQLKQIKEFMLKEKPYLENNITISQLSEQLEIQPHELSKIINENLHKNFFDFINTYRVEDVKRQLKEESKFTILGIAFESGFNSKSSFNRIFKKYTGQTPSQYKKQIAG